MQMQIGEGVLGIQVCIPAPARQQVGLDIIRHPMHHGRRTLRNRQLHKPLDSPVSKASITLLLCPLYRAVNTARCRLILLINQLVL